VLPLFLAVSIPFQLFPLIPKSNVESLKIIVNHVNISKIGLDGTWHWKKTFPDEDLTFSVWWVVSGVWLTGVPLDTIITSTGEYAIAGITTPPFDSKSIDAWLAKRDTNGNLLWKHIYGTNGDFKVINQTITIIRITNNQTSEGFELIPLLVGVFFLKFWSRRRRAYAKRKRRGIFNH